MLKIGIRLLFVLMAVAMTSCIPQKKLKYLQAPVEQKTVYQTPQNSELKIKPNDELLINVTSFDDVSFNYFESQKQVGGNYGTNELSLSMIAYFVDKEGKINFPILGKFSVAGLTLDEASDLLKSALSTYFNQPNVIVKFAYKKITVLGEVNHPGDHTYTKNQINIFEALGLAGDMTIHGNRSKVILLHTENNQTTKTGIDLTRDDLVFSKNYYLQPDDIIYVEPRNSVKWATISVPFTLIFSTITTALLVWNALK
jgi:polysaccharide biosynthesis/export protein